MIKVRVKYLAPLKIMLEKLQNFIYIKINKFVSINKSYINHYLLSLFFGVFKSFKRLFIYKVIYKTKF